jgi:type IV secretion system protein VirD4
VDRDGLSPFDLVVLVVGGAAALLIVVVWAGAALSLVLTGEPVELSVGPAAAALPRLVEHVARPARAWPEPVAARLPGAVVYWSCTAIAGAVVALLVVAALRLLAGPRVGTLRRTPLGVDARPMWATRRALRPLLVRGPVAGRFVVARFGRRLLATESAGTRGRFGRGRPGRRGDRGAVALVGPTRSGKTVAAIGGILEWEGPAVLSSVKADLLGATVGWRSRAGEVRVYDPTRTLGSVGGASVEEASWSPVGQAATVVGAQRAARALCEAAPRGGVVGGIDFWLAQAEILLAGLLYVAHHTHRDMGTVCEWVLLQDRPGELGPGEVRTCLDLVLASDDEEVMAGAMDASRGLLAIWEMEERTRSSVYATSQTVVWPWAEPEVASSSRGHSVDLDWVLSGANTVYLCAPIEDQRRLAPAFGGLLNDLIAQVYRRVAATGKPLDPPLLVVVDEAGNTPLRALPEYASTLSGLGVLLVTIWQSLAQIETAYGREADTILTNHLTKVFYAGLSDPASLRYVAQVLGDAEVETRARSMGEQAGRGSVQMSSTNVALAPAHALRQMRPGDALLLHGTLPPAHVRTRPFYRDRRLAGRSALRPSMSSGRERAGGVVVAAEAGVVTDGRAVSRHQAVVEAGSEGGGW